MSITERLVRLERLTLPRADDSAVRVCFVGMAGFAAPSACEDALLQQDERDHPGERFRFFRLFAPDGRCLACGLYHIAEPT